MRFPKKTKQIIASAIAFALLSVPFVQAAGPCMGSCHAAGRHKTAVEAGGTGDHSHGLHGHDFTGSSLLGPIFQATSWMPVKWMPACRSGIWAATCTMPSPRPLVALQGTKPHVTRGHHLLTASVSFIPVEMEPAQRLICRFEAAHAAVANAAPTPLFLKTLSLLI